MIGRTETLLFGARFCDVSFLVDQDPHGNCCQEMPTSVSSVTIIIHPVTSRPEEDSADSSQVEQVETSKTVAKTALLAVGTRDRFYIREHAKASVAAIKWKTVVVVWLESRP